MWCPGSCGWGSQRQSLTLTGDGEVVGGRQSVVHFNIWLARILFITGFCKTIFSSLLALREILPSPLFTLRDTLNHCLFCIPGPRFIQMVWDSVQKCLSQMSESRVESFFGTSCAFASVLLEVKMYLACPGRGPFYLGRAGFVCFTHTREPDALR